MNFAELSNIKDTTKHVFLNPEPYPGKGRISKYVFYAERRRTGAANATIQATFYDAASHINVRYHYDDDTVGDFIPVKSLSDRILYVDVAENVAEVELQFINGVPSGSTRFRIYSTLQEIHHNINGLKYIPINFFNGLNATSYRTTGSSTDSIMSGTLTGLLKVETGAKERGRGSLSYRKPGVTTFSVVDLSQPFTVNYDGTTGYHYYEVYEPDIISGDASCPVIMLYLLEEQAKEPTKHETVIGTTMANIRAIINRALTTNTASHAQSITSVSKYRVTKIAYSNVEPLLTATTSRALAHTGTKGNRIASKAFIHVKAVSSSLIDNIHTELSIKRQATVQSSLKKTMTSSESASSVSRRVTTHIDALHSHSEARQTRQFLVASSVDSIQTSFAYQLTATRAAVSTVRTLASNTKIFTKETREVITHSHLPQIDSAAHIELSIQSNSFSGAYSTSSSIEWKKLPRFDVVKSVVDKVSSNAQVIKRAEMTVHTHTKPIRSGVSITSAKGALAIVYSKVKAINTSAALSKQFEVKNTSNLQPLRSSNLFERDKVARVIITASTVRPLETKLIKESRALKMKLYELKLRLRIPADQTDNDELLLVYLDDAIDFVQRTCNQEFDPMPPVVKKVATQYVTHEFYGSGAVLSESIAGMSQTFESSDQRDNHLTGMLRKAGLLRLRFVNPKGRV